LTKLCRVSLGSCRDPTCSSCWPPAYAAGPGLALFATSGVATGEAVHITLAAAGLSALFVTFPSAFAAVRVAGAIYLLYLGIQSIRGRGGFRAGKQTPAQAHAGRTYLQGLLTNLSNPKMITFTIAFLPARATEGPPRH